MNRFESSQRNIKRNKIEINIIKMEKDLLGEGFGAYTLHIQSPHMHNCIHTQTISHCFLHIFLFRTLPQRLVACSSKVT